ncbi:hypothetical protein [Micrococcus sp. TA1]|uniref:hypothetical protein n=1 Tax=Micrococcus sp. TA1 TaxID=681627 RepID=UPI001618607E|nr:hypothetical protein [Micrococcus sp. TA1]MBB5750255.1 hypothetical protein [Micrococcus sp. TA1]
MERHSSGVGRPGLLEGVRDGAVEERTGQVPARTPAGPSFSVRGGPTSIHANLDELERGSMLLAAVAAESTALAIRAAGWGSLLTVAAQQSPLAGALGARTAELSSGLLAVGAEAEVLEHAVGFSVRSYREAEERALRTLQGVVGVPALLAAVVLVSHGRPVPVPVTELALHGLTELSMAVLGVMSPGAAVGLRIVSDVTGSVARDDGGAGPLTAPERLYPLITSAGIITGLVQIGPVTVRSLGPETAEYRMDGSLGGLMEQLDGTREGVAGPGAIRVTRVSPDAEDAPDRVWVVALPGTQAAHHPEDDGWSTNPFDVSGNGEAVALDSQHVAAAVHEALEAAGADPGDPVVLAGYSQGGIHAARTAADPRIAADFDVQGVFTVGSPTGEIALDPHVEALHLEHLEDPVPAVDGRGNPQGVNRTTVTFAGDVEGAEPEGVTLVRAHGFENYRAHVTRLEGHPDGLLTGQDGTAHQGGTAETDGSPPVTGAARLAPAQEHLARLTTGTAVSRTVTLERTRPGQPRNPLGAGLGHQFRATDPARGAVGRNG